MDNFNLFPAVSLVDHRGEGLQLIEIKEKDNGIHHEVLEGNILDLATYESLNRWLNGEKVDLIIERMGAGFEFVPDEPYTVSRILQIWYNLLREKGIMFVQTPVVFNNLLETWVAKIQKEFKNVIEIKYQEGVSNTRPRTTCSAFRLQKLPGAPKELPLLDPRTARKIQKAKSEP